LLKLAPNPNRIVFLDTEFTHLDLRRRKVWEIGGIIRDPGQPHIEFEWQIRPDLYAADPAALRIGGYYERFLLQDHPVGDAIIITDPDCPEPAPGEDIDYEKRKTTAAEIAAQLAPVLSRATIIAGVPKADEDTISEFLADHGQALTAEHRTHCIRTLVLGYLLGRRAERIIRLGVEPHPAGVPDFPWDPKELSTTVGVRLPAKAHRALVDARWASDQFDVIFAGNTVGQSDATDTTT
jgi:hypothetical protein